MSGISIKSMRTESDNETRQRHIAGTFRPSLVVDQHVQAVMQIQDANGRYTCLTLHALAAAIPHALLLLHALMDVLPYPVGPRGMWYEIKTGTVDCVDEVKGSGEGLSQKAQRKGGKNGAPGPTSELGEASEGVEGMDVDATAGDEAGGGEDFGDIGGMEEDEPQREIRLKVSLPCVLRQPDRRKALSVGWADSQSSLQIQLHIGPKRASIPANEAQTGREKGTKLPPILHKRNRPSKRQRTVNREAKTKAKGANAAEEGALNEMGIGEEEDMLNFV